MIRVTRLSIAPVRSLGLSHPEAVDLSPTGVLEDRRFYLTDLDNRLVDQLIAGRLVQVRATTDPEATWLALTFQDGRTIEGDVELGEAVETPIHGRVGVGHIVRGPWADALEPYAEMPLRLVRCDQPGGTRTIDGEVRNPVSLVSSGSVGRLAQALGVASLDGRRFRMLVEVDAAEPHAEDGWIGGRVSIGTATLEVTKADARCAITTHDPDTGMRDIDTLRGIIKYRGISEDRKALFGILAQVAIPGRVAIGDVVAVRPQMEVHS